MLSGGCLNDSNPCRRYMSRHGFDILYALACSHEHLAGNHFLISHQAGFREFDEAVSAVGVEHFYVAVIDECHQFDAFAVGFYAP